MANYIQVIKGLTAATISRVQTWMHKIRRYVYNLLSLHDPSKEELFRMALRRPAWGREAYACRHLCTNLPQHNRLIASYAQIKDAARVSNFKKCLRIYQALRDQTIKGLGND